MTQCRQCQHKVGGTTVFCWSLRKRNPAAARCVKFVGDSSRLAGFDKRRLALGQPRAAVARCARQSTAVPSAYTGAYMFTLLSPHIAVIGFAVRTVAALVLILRGAPGGPGHECTPKIRGDGRPHAPSRLHSAWGLRTSSCPRSQKRERAWLRGSRCAEVVEPWRNSTTRVQGPQNTQSKPGGVGGGAWAAGHLVINGDLTAGAERYLRGLG